MLIIFLVCNILVICHGSQHHKLKEFQSLENDVCHARRYIGPDGRWIKCGLNMKFIVYHMNFGKYLNFRKFLKIFFVRICFFQRIFFDKNVSSDKFSQRIFHFTSKTQKCTNFISFKTITCHYRFQ